MKKLLPFLSLLFLTVLAQAFPGAVDGRYVITADEDLSGQFIRLEKGSTVVFRGGTLRNGFLVGNDSRLELETDGPVFDEVQLNGTWSGSLTDEAFVYRENADHYRIVASLFRFNEVTFTRPLYRLAIWFPIYVNAQRQEVNGNGVVFQISSQKGEWDTRTWGRHYKRENLFCNEYDPSGNWSYAYHDLTILDNRDLFDEPGWGEDVGTFINYSYFTVIGREILFDGVHSDGAGVLEKIYNLLLPIDAITFRDCSVRTSQFAVEIQNFSRESEAVRCDRIAFDGCSFYQYGAQKYVGLLSVAGTVPTGEVLIRNCRFDGREKAGNLELTLAKRIEVSGCSFVNQFLQSEAESEIQQYDVHDNSFRFTRHVGTQPYSVGGGNIRFSNNVVVFDSGVTHIRVIGKVDTFEEWGNKYYEETRGRRKRFSDPPFRAFRTVKVSGSLVSFLRSLYYRF